MVKVGDTFEPGQKAPIRGFYECDGLHNDKHRWEASVAGKKFPPLPDDCTGKYWVLRKPGL